MKPDPSDAGTPASVVPEYEAPCVETVLTSDEVEREAHYGGNVSMT
ncbi:hypothetical protein K2Z84_19310 [Candidatus Binatia bacterium]|jgi:hypothetical protein|nr:hypothetical protein [Candidatus Binatia bacterium]